MNSPSDHDADALRQEIEITRRRMDETLAALGQRLRPRHLLDELIGCVRRDPAVADGVARASAIAARTLRRAGRVVIDNPIPAALAGVGIGWLIFQGLRDHSSNGDNDEAATSRPGAAPASAEPASATPEEIRNLLDGLRHDLARAAPTPTRGGAA